MTSKEKLQKFLEFQQKDIKFDEIANKLNVTPRALRSFMNRNGYKAVNGKYISKDNKDTNTNLTKINITKSVSKSKSKPKKGGKINITQDDMDKLCEVYDWYLSVKDCKALKPKKKNNLKDIDIEESNISDLKSTNIRVDKNTWTEFERLCSNSNYNKSEIITQALKNFMREYKHLL